jgi:hypothetical protein
MIPRQKSKDLVSDHQGYSLDSFDRGKSCQHDKAVMVVMTRQESGQDARLI